MKRKHPAINKITPPDLPEVMLREALFDLLDQKQHYRITWISGMAGSGKSTLAASYLAARSIPCLWYQIDERDNDVPTFFYYLGLAARRALPRMRKPLPLLTLEYQANTSKFAQQYFENLCNRLTASFFMVFDNFQNVSQTSDFQTIFQKGISRVSPDIHVIILSRTDPPPVFAGMLANNQMRVVSPDTLNLTLEETAIILEHESSRRLAPKTIQDLHKKTRGWPAGLILMAKHFQKKNTLPDHIDEGVPSEVYDYFTGECFDSLAEDLKEFLMQTAFLPTMTANTARKLTGQPRAAHILSSVHKEHLFIERFSASAYTYQLHPLFRDFLMSKAREIFKAEKINRIQQQAGSILESTGHIEDAAECFTDIDDTASLIRLIQTHAITLIKQGRLEILISWLNKIPEKMLLKNPWLLFWMGMSYRPGSATEARSWFEKSFSVFEKANDRTGLYLSWTGIIDSIILAWDAFKPLDPWIDWLDNRPHSETMSPVVEIDARVAACMSGALIIRKPQHPRLTFWIERALDLSLEISDTTTQLKTGIWAITFYMWNGDFARAALVKEKARKFIRLNTPSPMTLQFWKWLEISANVRTMKAPGEALEQVLHLLEEADKKGQHHMDHMFFPPGMFAALVLGEFSKAELLLDRFDSIPEDTHRHGLAIFHHFKGLYFMLMGRPNQAIAHAEVALKMVRRTGYLFYEALCLFQMAHVLQDLGRFKQADTHLKQAYTLSIEIKSRMLRFMCLLKKAHILFAREKKDEGRVCLREAMTLGRHHDYVVMLWWWDPVMMAQLCAEAILAGIETDYAKRIIRIHHLSPDTRKHHIQDWPWTVKINTFGRFQPLVDGKPLRFRGRSPKKPLELLQAMIAFGGDDVPIERFLDALWDEADGDMAHSAFSTALNRLRKLLRDKRAIRLENGKISLNPLFCWIDALAFQDIINEGNTQWDHQNQKKAIDLYEKALSYYKGPFLFGETNTPWIISARERHKNQFLLVITRLGQWQEQSKQFEKAMAWYEKGLSIDDLEELLYQRLMACQLQLGLHSDLAKTYQRCRDRLLAAFNVAPSRETEMLRRQIIRQA